MSPRRTCRSGSAGRGDPAGDPGHQHGSDVGEGAQHVGAAGGGEPGAVARHLTSTATVCGRSGSLLGSRPTWYAFWSVRIGEAGDVLHHAQHRGRLDRQRRHDPEGHLIAVTPSACRPASREVVVTSTSATLHDLSWLDMSIDCCLRSGNQYQRNFGRHRHYCQDRYMAAAGPGDDRDNRGNENSISPTSRRTIGRPSCRWPACEAFAQPGTVAGEGGRMVRRTDSRIGKRRCRSLRTSARSAPSAVIKMRSRPAGGRQVSPMKGPSA